jgi:uncharacterized protein YkwD
VPTLLRFLRRVLVAACAGWLATSSAAAADAAGQAKALAAEAARLLNDLRERPVQCGIDDAAAPADAQPRLASLDDAAARPRLAWNPQLAHAAEDHAQAMAEQAFFDHVDPEGHTVAQRSTAAGYRWRVIGENLAAGQPALIEALRDWLASPSHCRNLVDARFTEFGLARVTSAYPTDPYGVYWVLVFGRPRDLTVASR